MSRTSLRVPRPVLDLRESAPTYPGPLRGSSHMSRISGRVPDPTRTTGSVPQPIPDFREGPSTRPVPP